MVIHYHNGKILITYIEGLILTLHSGVINGQKRIHSIKQTPSAIHAGRCHLARYSKVLTANKYKGLWAAYTF